MKCVTKIPYAAAHKAEISNDLDTIQSIVGGYIEVIPLPVKGLWLVCNEEGKLQGLDANIYIHEYNDTIVGTLMIVNSDDNGDFIDMTNDDCAFIVNWLNERDAIKIIKERMQK